MNPFDNPRAFSPMLEPLKWREDKSPHATGTIRGTVLHGSPDAVSAGHPLGTFVADPWVVQVPRSVALAHGIKVGDTLTRFGIDGEVLSVQQLSRDDSGWIFFCTVNERPTA